MKTDHDLYIPTIPTINIVQSHMTKKFDELTRKEKAELKGLRGQRMWVASQTRPDLSCEKCAMINTGKHSTVKMLLDANKALAKLKSKKAFLHNLKNMKVLAYSEATYGSQKNGSSQIGMIIFDEGEDKKVVPTIW